MVHHRVARAQVAGQRGAHQATLPARHRGGLRGAKAVAEPALHGGLGHRVDALRFDGGDALLPLRAGFGAVAGTCVGDHHRLEPLGAAHGEFLADHAAQRQADPHDRPAVEAVVELGQQPLGVAGQIGQGVGAAGGVGVAVAAVVVADHAVVARQRIGQLVPQADVAAQCVAEHDGVLRRGDLARLAHGVVQGGRAGAAIGAPGGGHGRFGGGQRRRRLADLAQQPRGDAHAGVGRGHAGVDGRLHQHFLDVVRAELRFGVARAFDAGHTAAGERGAQVQLELLPAAQRGGDRHHDDAPRLDVQPRAAPDLMPGVAGDEVLEFGGEVVGAGHRLVDPGVTQHAAPVAHAALEIVVVGVHGVVSVEGNQDDGRKWPQVINEVGSGSVSTRPYP